MIELTPEQKLKMIYDLDTKVIFRWLWTRNRALGGTIPFYLFGTDKEHKALSAFKASFNLPLKLHS